MNAAERNPGKCLTIQWALIASDKPNIRDRVVNKRLSHGDVRKAVALYTETSTGGTAMV
jgi:hypothetical protein